MSRQLDELDRKILNVLQDNNLRTLDELAKIVGSSKTPVWNRINKMRESGVIKKEVAILDPTLLGFESCFFVLIRTDAHEKNWQDRFLSVLEERKEVIEAYRLAGDIDYILKIRVRNAREYDDFYQALISQVKVSKVTALLSIEEIMNSTSLPL